jgi:hypothetical protein
MTQQAPKHNITDISTFVTHLTLASCATIRIRNQMTWRLFKCPPVALLKIAATLGLRLRPSAADRFAQVSTWFA